MANHLKRKAEILLFFLIYAHLYLLTSFFLFHSSFRCRRCTGLRLFGVRNVANIQSATCALLLFCSKDISTYVTKICAFNEFWKKMYLDDKDEEKKRCILCAISPKQAKNCSSFRIASIVRLSLFMHRADSLFGNDCTCSDVRHKTTISGGKIDLEFN